MFNFRNILGVRIDELDISIDDVLTEIMRSKNNLIIPMDVSLFLKVRKNPKLRKIVNTASLVIPTDKALSKNYSINEFTLYSKILTYMDEAKSSFFVFGSEEKYILKSFEKIKRLYPNITIVGHYDILSYKKSAEKTKILEGIRKISADTVAIYMKFPQNIIWFDENKNDLNTKIYLLSSKPFDVFSGKKNAPPYKVIQNNSSAYYLIKNPFLLLKYIYFYYIMFLNKIFSKKKL